MARHLYLLLAALACLGQAGAQPRIDQSSVNREVRIGAGTLNGDVSSVNGRIDIGAGARVGAVGAVNGAIRIGEGARVESVESVNGTVRLARDVDIEGRLETVNGGVHADAGSRLGDGVATVNGLIDLDGVLVEGDVETHDGTITLVDTRVSGNLHVRKPASGWSGRTRRPETVRVELAGSSRVEGDLIFERPVELALGEEVIVGEIRGEVTRVHRR